MFQWSKALHTLRPGHAHTCQHQELLMGLGCMDGHSGRTSPLKCCASIIGSFQCGYGSFYVQNLLIPRAALVHACTGQMSSSGEVRVPWSSLSSHTHTRLRSVIARLRPSVTSNTCTRTVTWGDMTDDPVVGSQRHTSYLQRALVSR